MFCTRHIGGHNRETSTRIHGRFSSRDAAVLLGVLFLAVAPIAASSAENLVDFESKIAPLLVKRCAECHQGNDPSGGLLLTSRNGLIAGGESGKAVDLQNVAESYVLQRIEQGEMPPDVQGRSQKLPDEEIELIRRWLKEGATWPDDRELDYFERTNDLRAGRDWWSLQPVTRPAVPRLNQHPQPENPIDAFVLAKLETEGLTPAPQATRQTLIRRAYHDLIGLPPTDKEIAEFRHDDSPDAWPKLIDRLLKMPQYGERWGRYWMDLVRYADTSGYERDQEKPFAWKYRDWVVSAFNTDMPYDQFIVEQLAGDEISNRSEKSVIATGFLRLGAWNDEPNDPADYVYERLEDLVHTTSSAFLALTVKCARCHSHKFDAIKQEDYYKMASAFWGGPIGNDRAREHLGGPTADELGFSDVLGWTDLSPNPPPLHILKNGERHQPMQEVVPASLSSIPSLQRTFERPPNGATTSQRRLQLARWIADARNPLTYRVFVNRLWQHHFGKAIVRTPNNFGFLADPPTHPKLLDWLAAEFLDRGRSMKAMHRLILTSRTWQQSSLHPRAKEYELKDSGNRLWWRAERQRLDAETLRDSLLAASGELDLTVGGEGFKPTISLEALEGLSRKSRAWQESEPDAQKRRSLYMYLKRGLLPPMMTTFDLCDPTHSCGKRDVTVVPTQALALLNNRFVHDRSEHLASTIATQTTEIQKQIQLAWTHVLRRGPSAAELESSQNHLADQLEEFSNSNNGELSLQPTVGIDEAIASSLVLHIRTDQSKVSQEDEAQVESVTDLSGNSHHASQPNSIARPTLKNAGFGGQPTLVFNGENQFLKIAGQILSTPVCTIICVANDHNSTGHRELISNWDGAAGNSTSSLFLGLTGENAVRFSDAFSPAGHVTQRTTPFILSAVNGTGLAEVFQNGRRLKVAANVANRRFDTAWVIGQQGNINGEYWKGEIAEIRVYNRDLSHEERQFVEQQLAERYALSLDSVDTPQLSPETRALASLCHVLMNSNEFLYVD